MEKTKFTILGMTGSGKTCYMLGMYYEVSAGMNGYTIVADDRDTDHKLAQRYEILNDKSRGRDRFPQATDQVESLLFNLQYAYDDIMQFEWLDYPGGILDFRNTADEAREELIKSVKESSVLMVCIDGSDFCGNNIRSKINKVRRSSGNINRFFSEYMKNNEGLPPIAFVVTKFDLCHHDTNEEEIKDVIEESFPGLFIENDEDNEKSLLPIAIIPVSLGVGIEDDESRGDLEPINIQIPIFYGIWFSLVFKHYEYEAAQKYVSEEIEKLDSQKRDEEDSFFLWRSNDKIRKLRNDIEEGKSILNELKNINRAMEKSRNKLDRELSAINMVYYKGKWGTWNDLEEAK